MYWTPQPHGDALIKAALRVIEADNYPQADDPNADAEQWYSADQLALAARNLVRAVDALPVDEQPSDWAKS